MTAPSTPEPSGLRAALDAILALPTVVPDHPHGGVYPPYLEWTKVAEIIRAAATTPEPSGIVQRAHVACTHCWCGDHHEVGR